MSFLIMGSQKRWSLYPPRQRRDRVVEERIAEVKAREARLIAAEQRQRKLEGAQRAAAAVGQVRPSLWQRLRRRIQRGT
jgi:hypothetical protein